MTRKELGQQIALGIIETGVEGGYDAVSCSTAGDYPSMGVSQWEGINDGRGDTLLSYIDGGDYFADRTYSDIEEAGELDALSELLNSEQGQIAQQMILSQDCADMYVDRLLDVWGFTNPACIIYAGIWCPTSHEVVGRFLERRRDRGVDINDLDELYITFKNEYAIAADCEECAEGYENVKRNNFDFGLCWSAVDYDRFCLR